MLQVKNLNVFVLGDQVEMDDPAYPQGKVVPGPLTRLLAHDDIPVKQAYWIAKFARKIREELGLIEGQNNVLICKYGTENDGRVRVNKGDANWEAFVQEHNELMDMETDLDVNTVQIPDNVAIPIGDLMALDAFIEIITV